MRAAIYARVSSKAQASDDKESLALQLEDCKKYCERQSWQVVGEYRDTISAITSRLDDRPGLSRALRDAKAGRFDVLVYSSLPGARLSRDLAHGLEIIAKFKAAGVDIYSSDGTCRSSETFASEVLTAIQFISSKEEIRRFASRSMQTKLRKAQQGKIVSGRRPYGYRIKDQSLIPDPIEAPIVQELFERYTDPTVSIGDLIRDLDERGIPGPTGKGWALTTIRRILSSKTYKGQWEYRKMASIKPGSRVYKATDPSDRVTVPCPALVDEETWEIVQRRLKEKAEGLRKAKERNAFPLRHRMRCTCGATLSRRTVKGEKYQDLIIPGKGKEPHRVRVAHSWVYYVHADKKKSAGCPLKSLKADEVDAAVFGFVWSLIRDPSEVERRVRELQENADERNAPIHAQIESIRAQIKRESNALSAALYLDIDDPDLRKTLDDKATQIQDRVRRLKETLADLEAQLIPVPEIDERILRALRESEDMRYLRAYLGIDPDAGMDELPPDEARWSLTYEQLERLYKELDVRVLVEPTGRNSAQLTISTALSVQPEDGISGVWAKMLDIRLSDNAEIS